MKKRDKARLIKVFARVSDRQHNVRATFNLFRNKEQTKITQNRSTNKMTYVSD